MTNEFYNGRQQYSQKSWDKLAGSAQFLFAGLLRRSRSLVSRPRTLLDGGNSRRANSVPNAILHNVWHSGWISPTKLGLILLWVLLLWWGERQVFRNSISSCQWESWEAWPSDTTPHHAVLLADPQLVDPHTYPGRPWPLSTLTVRHTDLYLQRAFASLQQILDPETTFFLGDLFDGGREWATGKDKQKDSQWKRYDSRFWLKEYARFGRIFLDHWIIRAPLENISTRKRKFIASLPGNHDLGLGNGISLSVRDRFTTFFGLGNRIDIVGNHTFISVDTVSLSARGQAQSDNLRHNEAQEPNQEIWGITDGFLSDIKAKMSLAVDRELRARAGQPENRLHAHEVLDIHDPKVQSAPPQPFLEDVPQLPSVLLTHVPLYRSPGTPCGPLRERWPPSKSADNAAEPLESDDANAISVSAGYQYQNVLQPDVSRELVEKIGNFEHVFSGDDHDYCAVVHHGFTSKGRGVREITVKSMSWAMGVRKPGFLMVSLWNPIDGNRRSSDVPISSSRNAGDITLRSHLCLLPDQLSIFIRYGVLLGFTLTTLLFRAFIHGFKKSALCDGPDEPSLPTERPPNACVGSDKRDRAGSMTGLSTYNYSGDSHQHSRTTRSSAGRPRSLSPTSGYGIPDSGSVYSKSSLSRVSAPGWDESADDAKPRRRAEKGMRAVWRETRRSTVQVALVGLLWYVWLAYTS
ncbi:hypothetical protein MMC13_007603 [Lambiella insularis]|nr:hypothetical protein [Lambiella insularis]